MNRRGMPRPLADHAGQQRPVPWSQDGMTAWGKLNESRALIAREEGLCLLCGILVHAGSVIVSTDHPNGLLPVYQLADLTGDYSRVRSEIVDIGPLHDRCARMTLAHCPHLRDEADVEIRPYQKEVA